MKTALLPEPTVISAQAWRVTFDETQKQPGALVVRAATRYGEHAGCRDRRRAFELARRQYRNDSRLAADGRWGSCQPGEERRAMDQRRIARQPGCPRHHQDQSRGVGGHARADLHGSGPVSRHARRGLAVHADGSRHDGTGTADEVRVGGAEGSRSAQPCGVVPPAAPAIAGQSNDRDSSPGCALPICSCNRPSSRPI